MRKPRNQEFFLNFLVSWFPHQIVFGGLGWRKEQFRFRQPHLRQPKLRTDAQTAKTVFATALEIDGRGFLEILRRATDFANREPVPQNLRDHLVVENKIIR